MLFNSFVYLCFLPIVFVLYWLINNNLKLQNLLLLAASYLFYGWWDWRFLSLIVLSSVIDYTIGLKIHESDSDKSRKNYLYISLFANLGLLGVFKYYNFFAESFSDLMQLLGWTPNDLTLNIILPVGISFYTFQTLSYTIDIYRRTLTPTKDVISFFTYIAFFPQLVAGPIERAANLLPQMESKRSFDETMFKEGILQMVVGLFRKIVIADTIAVYVDTAYANPHLHNSTTLVLATILYAFQIYFDFSGYSDIAIGSAKLLGFRFAQNFNIPYFSTSITEFWRKWHMSLSYWLRDYLYISLGGNRKGIWMTYRNLSITMLLGGLWHGSSWNFIIWGGIHGIALSVEKFLNSKNLLPAIRNIKVLGLLSTFGIVLFAWIFFRAQTFDAACMVIGRIGLMNFGMPFIDDISIFVNILLVVIVGVLFDYYLFRKNIHLENLGADYSIPKLIIVTTITVMFINLFYSTSNNFIYFQF